MKKGLFLVLGAVMLAFSFTSCEKNYYDIDNITNIAEDTIPCNPDTVIVHDTIVPPPLCIEIALISSSTNLNEGSGPADDIVEFEITFEIEAECDGDVYIPKSITIPIPGNTVSNTVTVDRGGVLVINQQIKVTLSSTADETANGNFKIEEGDTEEFTVLVEMDNEAANGGVGVPGLYRAQVSRILYSLEDDNTYISTAWSDLKTWYESVNKR